MMHSVEDAAMTSRERVLAAIRGQLVDRVPVMYWLNPHATCRLMAEIRPGQNLVWNSLAGYLWRRFRQGGEFDEGAWTRVVPLLLEEHGNGRYVLELGADVAILSPELINPTSFAGSVRKKDGRLAVQGPFGGTLALGGIYMDPVEPAVVSMEDLESLPLPEVHDRHFSAIRRLRRAHPDACLLVEVVSFQRLRGFRSRVGKVKADPIAYIVQDFSSFIFRGACPADDFP